MIPTPTTSHVKREEWADVYEPAEDTFALLDALEGDAALLQAKQTPLVVELGVGSGVVSAFTARLLGRRRRGLGLGTDLNPAAASVAVRTAAANAAGPLEVVNTSLLACLAPRLAGKIDVLLFNPPYVPTTGEEERLAQLAAPVPATARTALAAAWAGGQTGTALVDALVHGTPLAGGVALAALLAPDAYLYLVAIKQNDPPELVRALRHTGLDAQVCLFRGAHASALRCAGQRAALPLLALTLVPTLKC